MIAELFLAGAMALPPMSFSHPRLNDATGGYKMILHTADFMLKRHLDKENRTLVVGGNPGFVTAFREAGFNAYGALTDDIPGVTAWHAVTNFDHLSFQSRIFHAVYVFQSNPMNETAYDSLKEAIRMITDGGFLVFSEEDYPDWKTLLHFWNWERMALVFSGFAVWKRPYPSNGLSYAFKKSMAGMRRNVLPFRQSWIMRGTSYARKAIAASA